MKQITVCDSCTLIKLNKGGILNYLGHLFDKIYIPQAVVSECKDSEIFQIVKQPPFEICQVQQVLPIGLGIGEREAISLAAERKIKIIITDDKKAQKKALKHGLLFLHTRHVLLALKKSGKVASVQAIMDKMIEAGEGIKEEEYLVILGEAGER